jgi:hypothetical protein
MNNYKVISLTFKSLCRRKSSWQTEDFFQAPVLWESGAEIDGIIMECTESKEIAAATLKSKVTAVLL